MEYLKKSVVVSCWLNKHGSEFEFQYLKKKKVKSKVKHLLGKSVSILHGCMFVLSACEAFTTFNANVHVLCVSVGTAACVPAHILRLQKCENVLRCRCL